MSHPTVTPAHGPHLVADTICCTELGLSIENTPDAGDFTHLYCHAVIFTSSCLSCGLDCRVRDHFERRLTGLAIAWLPSVLHVRVLWLARSIADYESKIFRGTRT